MPEEPIYLDSIHPVDARKIDALTIPKNWDSGQFKDVLVALGTVGGGYIYPQ